MASLRDIRRRIRSVKNTEKITKTMKMVSAAKLRKAQSEVQQARAFALGLEDMVQTLVGRMQNPNENHPLLMQKPQLRRIEILVLTSDRGLCGGLNSNVVRKAYRFFKDTKPTCPDIHISTLGKKGYDFFRREQAPIRTNYAGILESPSYQKAHAIAEEVCQSYIQNELDGVFLVYNNFQSAISQKVVVQQMLPIVPKQAMEALVDTEFMFEPGQEALLSELLPRYFATSLYQAFLEAVASEHGARMTAMDNATRNAKEMIQALTLVYNRARQASITKELMEIIGGAEALAA